MNISSDFDGIRARPAELLHPARFLLCLWLLLWLVPYVHALPANADLSLPSSGISVLPGDVPTALLLTGSDSAAAHVNVVSVQGQAFGQALRAQTVREPAMPYSVALSARTIAPIKKGDVLLATFWLRCIDSRNGEAMVGFVFDSEQPRVSSANYEAVAGAQWQRFDVPFAAAGDYAPGQGIVNLRLGYLPQTVEVGGLSVVNYGSAVTLESLPASPSTYMGRGPDSPWRKAAQERIEKYRKANLQVRVVNAAGRPVVGAQVTVAMQRHAFGFGAALNAKNLLSHDPADAMYQAKVKELFTEVVLANDLKWKQWEGNPQIALQAAHWLHDNNIRLRAHNLVWPNWVKIPDSVHDLKDNKEALSRRIDTHIRDEAGALRGLATDWDVLNEVYAKHEIVDILGQTAMLDWFQTAREADPKAMDYINDYDILENTDRTHQDAYFKTIQYLIQNGAPLDGIGFQGHFGTRLTAPDKLLETLNRFAGFKKRLKVTEFDINMTDEKLQGDYTRDFMTMMFSHPSIDGIIMWSFWDGLSYAPHVSLWRKDWSMKPNAQAWTDLVFKQWWTKAQGRSDKQGAYRTRGFLGDYEVSATFNGRTKTVPVTLAKSGAAVTLTLN